MKRCPACDKTFPDAMKFCQTDGTLLVDDAPAADPYKTVVANQSDIASAIPPLDPFKTMVATPPRAEEDILQLPEEPDSLKTMLVSQDELLGELKAGGATDVPALEITPPPSPSAASAPLIEPKPASAKDFSPPAPKFNEPAPGSPNFGNLSSPPSDLPKSETASSNVSDAISSNVSKESAPPSPFDSKPFSNDLSTQSPFGTQENKPIPSPFDGSMVGYLPPSAPPPNAPKPPVKEAEKPFGDYQEPANPSPFQPPSPFGQAEPFNPPMQQTEWTPPPAPVSEWQNQEMNANTPFQPPPAGQGQNQTLPIISLVLGILSICCYVSPLTGIAAVVTGYLGMKNANTDPAQYGGKTMAIIGMVLGGLFFLIGIIYYIFVLIVGVSGFIPN